MAATTKFCGRCGNVLDVRATFCGRCGTPQMVAAPPPPPAYAYPMAPPAVVHASGGIKTSHIGIAAIVLVLLALSTIGVSAFAVGHIVGTKPVCTANCGPKLGVPLKEPTTYTSSAFHFEVDYSPNWTVRSKDANGISLGTRHGLLEVKGSKSSKSDDDVVRATVAALPSAKWQDVQALGDIKGAHLGEQDGAGLLYSANLMGANSTGTKVRIAVIAAKRHGISVVLFAVNPESTDKYPNGMAEGQSFDHVCQEFRWS